MNRTKGKTASQGMGKICAEKTNKRVLVGRVTPCAPRPGEFPSTTKSLRPMQPHRTRYIIKFLAAHVFELLAFRG
jgi:hypothetical protein